MSEIKLIDYFQDGYILVADDEINMRKTIRNMLRVIGVRDVVEAEDGQYALEILRKEGHSALSKVTSKRCLFILSDWNMKYMSGIDFAMEVRGDKDIENIPILLITANLDPNYVTRSVEAGVSGYIIKPLTPAILEEKISKVINSRANPPEHVKLINAGEMLFQQGSYKEALAQLEAAFKMQPSSSRILVLMGEVYEKLNNDKQAKKFFDKATELNPQYLKGYTAKANYLIAHGDKKEALVALEQAAKISPHNADRQTDIGQICLEEGKVEKAKAAFDQAIKQDPKKTKEVGEVYLKAGKAKEAESFFREALKLNTDYKSQQDKEYAIHTFNRLGIALRKQGLWEEATLEYKKALKIDPNNEVLYYNLGKAFLEGGKKEEAKSSFKKALLIDSQFKEAKEEMDAIT